MNFFNDTLSVWAKKKSAEFFFASHFRCVILTVTAAQPAVSKSSENEKQKIVQI